MNNNCHSFDWVADKEGMMMKDGIWKLSGMKGLILAATFMMFGLASIASATTVTYYTMGDNGTNVASGVTTDYNSGCQSGQNGPVTTLMSQTSNFCGNYEYSSAMLERPCSKFTAIQPIRHQPM